MGTNLTAVERAWLECCELAECGSAFDAAYRDFQAAVASERLAEVKPGDMVDVRDRRSAEWVGAVVLELGGRYTPGRFKVELPDGRRFWPIPDNIRPR